MRLGDYGGIGLVPEGDTQVAAFLLIAEEARRSFAGAAVTGRVLVPSGKVVPRENLYFDGLPPTFVGRLARKALRMEIPDGLPETLDIALDGHLRTKIAGAVGAVILVVLNNGAYERIERDYLTKRDDRPGRGYPPGREPLRRRQP